MLCVTITAAAGALHPAAVFHCRIYRGDWMQGAMHGCGARIWKQPDGSMAAAEGTFFHDEYVGDIMPCSKEDAFDNAVEADMAAFQARSFQVGRAGRAVTGCWACGRVCA